MLNAVKATKKNKQSTAVIFNLRFEHLNTDSPAHGPEHLNRHVWETTQSDSIHLEPSFIYNSCTQEQQISELPL